MTFLEFISNNYNTPIQQLFRFDPDTIYNEESLICSPDLKVSIVVKKLLEHELQSQILVDDNNTVVSVVTAQSLLSYFVKM